MEKRVLILGGGDGGTILANRLARRLGPDELSIEVIDKEGTHWYQPGFLFSAVGEAEREEISLCRVALYKENVKFTQAEVTKIDLDDRKVSLKDGSERSYDYLVIATGSTLYYDDIPGFKGGADHFWSFGASMRLRKKLMSIKSGRVLVGVGGLTYKCPVAPLEMVFLADELFRRRGVRDSIELVYLSPMGRAYGPHLLNKLVEEEMAKRGIELVTYFTVDEIDGKNRKVMSAEGDSLDYDILILSPPHRGSEVIINSGIGDDEGWVPVDKHFLTVKGYDDAFAIGDATALPIPKTGVVAHFQAATLANNIAADIRGGIKETFDGQSFCLIEMGESRASAQVSNYRYNIPPGLIPNWLFHAMKMAFTKMYWKYILTGLM